MQVLVVDERKEVVPEPYVIRLGGWTLERYLREAPEHARWEFAYGEVLVYSPASAEHQDQVGFLYRLLAGYCETRGWGKVLMGPAAVRLSSEVVREPDLFVLAPEDVARAHGSPLQVRPVLVVEVTSPSTRRIDLIEKAQDYAQAGIPEYWVVDTDGGAVVAHRLREGLYERTSVTAGRLESQAVPGFWLDVGW
ncbi:MAG: Uma2 family endonuclease, partial [Acidobacteriota bacterium]|nr:Uma2 family endonuclease [Acidobacteriota bacterium]